MWLTYVDESGNTGTKLDDPNQPHHVLAGVSVCEDVVNHVAEHLDAVSLQFLGSARRSTATEFHAAQLKGGDGPWRGVKPPVRIDAFKAALEPLSWDGVFVSYASVDKVAYASRHDGRSPHLWALQFLIEELNSEMRQRGERTLLVADETNEHEQFALDLLTAMQSGNPPRGLKMGSMSQIVDSVHFVRSETNRGVQLTDLVAYLRFRLLSADPAKVAVERELWNSHVMPYQQTWREPWP